MGIDCYLNEEFYDALEDNRFQWKKKQKTYEIFDYSQRVNVTKKKFQLALVDTKADDAVLLNDPYEGANVVSRLSCCGISELHLLTLMPLFKKYGATKFWGHLVATYMWQSIKAITDERVIIVGLPVRVGGGSQYDADYYKSLVDLFSTWGFTKVNDKPYRNMNSNNDIFVMVCRVPQ